MTRAAFTLLFIVLLLGGPFAAWGQEPEASEPQVDTEEQAPADDPLALGEVQSPDDIDRILEGDEEIFAGAGYGYDPGDRRDPFRSLLGGTEEVQLRGPRPEGVPGLLIDEVEVTGIFETAEGPVAQVQVADSATSFLIRSGDDLYDGSVVQIRLERYGAAEVEFRQRIQDPASPKPYREVIKKLNP